MDTLSTQKPLEVYKPQFHGKAAEFFKIWIVNVVLSILTVGIYSAWAKVRTRKYIYGNLELAGSRFDYHADPIKILKGRLIVGGIFLIYYFGGLLSPTLSAVAGLAFLMIFPWIIVKALMFNLYNTSYRNIRFGFVDDVKGCYTTGIKAALITVVTIGLAVPYAHYLFARFKVSNMKYGKEKFSFGAHAKSFFGVYYSAFGMALLLYLACLLLVLAFAAVSGSLTDLGKEKNPEFIKRMSTLGVLVMLPIVYGVLIYVTAWINAKKYNLILVGTKLGEIQFKGTLQVNKLAWIYLSNLLGCIFTLGLLIPWAVLRTHQYRFSNTEVLAKPETLNAIVTDESLGEMNARADAASDFWDLDIGL